MRIHFYNLNKNSGQGVTVTTSGNGERHGEGSLAFERFLPRLFLFHDEPLRAAPSVVVPAEALSRVRRMAVESWAADRVAGTDGPAR